MHHKSSSFGTYKSVNHRLPNKLTQADQYQAFLKRIDNIVQRKHKADTSADFYMTFLNKSRQRSNKQKQANKDYFIQLQNKHLLQKIQKAKTRPFKAGNNTVHEVHLYQKRIRQQDRINAQNSKMAARIMSQSSYLAKNKLVAIDYSPTNPNKGISQERQAQQKFFDSRIRNRKLPRLNSTKVFEPNSSVNSTMIR